MRGLGGGELKTAFPWPKGLQRGVRKSKRGDGVCPNIRGHQRIMLPGQVVGGLCMSLENLPKEMTVCLGNKGVSPAQQRPPRAQAQTLLWKLGLCKGVIATELCRPDPGSLPLLCRGKGETQRGWWVFLWRLRGPKGRPNRQPFVLAYFKRTSPNRP